MYWGTLIAIDSLVNSNLDPKIELSFEKKEWVIKIDSVLYRKNDLIKKKPPIKNKALRTYQYIQFKKTSYGTEIVEVRSSLDSPWYLGIETRGKIKVIDDLKGLIKITEDHHIKIHQLKTGKNIVFTHPIKCKVLTDNYFVVWLQNTDDNVPKLYQLPEMELIETKLKDQNIQRPEVVEL